MEEEAEKLMMENLSKVTIRMSKWERVPKILHFSHYVIELH